MKINQILLIIPFLFIFISSGFAQYAKSEFSSAAKAADGMSKALNKIDKARKVSDAIAGVSKFAKLAKGFAAASIALEIGGALFGGEEENIRMLKEITKLVKQINNKLDKLAIDVETGFNKLENGNEYRSAQSQVFQSISHINGALEKIDFYSNTTTEAANREAIIDVLRINIDQISTDVENIMRSINGANGTLASNLLDASVIKSNANFEFVKGICTQLLSAVTSAAYVESMYSQLILDDEALRDAARVRVSSKYAEKLDQMERLIRRTLNNCTLYNTVYKYAQPALDAANDRNSNMVYPDQLVQRMHIDLSNAWPNMEIIIAAYDKKNSDSDFEVRCNAHFMNNLSKFHESVIELPWENKNHDLEGVLWVVSKDFKDKFAVKTDSAIKGMTEDEIQDDATDLTWALWTENLHKYYDNGSGFNVLAHFAAFEKCTKMAGLPMPMSKYGFYHATSDNLRLVTALHPGLGEVNIFVSTQ